LASVAFTDHLLSLLRDSDHLDDASSQLPLGIPGRPLRVAATNRAIVVISVSAWEAYIEELVRESINAFRPPAPPLGLWPALNATVRGQLGRFNTPNTENVRMLISDAIGLQDIQTHWTWRRCTSNQAVQRLAVAMKLRHEIAHGVKPRPFVATDYASRLPGFFRQLGRYTDRAVRAHPTKVLGIASPWRP
jgi:hypothetical protein